MYNCPVAGLIYTSLVRLTIAIFAVFKEGIVRTRSIDFDLGHGIVLCFLFCSSNSSFVSTKPKRGENNDKLGAVLCVECLSPI